jgi:hypothetical protein
MDYCHPFVHDYAVVVVAVVAVVVVVWVVQHTLSELDQS